MDFARNAQLRIIIIIFFLCPLLSQAYPEMIRHGYVNCSACHTTHQGGDLLTAYGKELSKEIFSRTDSLFQTTKNNDEAYWRVNTPEWLTLGSHVRLLQTLSESSIASKGRFMVMQVDVDANARVSDLVQVYASVGRYEPTAPDAEWKDFIYTPRAWVQFMKNFNNAEDNLSLRVGRFYPVYGVNIIEHTYANRRYLEFNPGQERLSAELAYSTQDYQVVATGISQRSNFQKYNDERGYSVQLSKVFGKSARAGINFYKTQLNVGGVLQNKQYDGLYALIGWTTEISTLLQADRIYNQDGKNGFVNLLKLGYEYTKGVQFFATQEYYSPDTTVTDPHMDAFGLGVQYFPFTNFDLFLTFKKQKDSAQLNEYQNVMWLIAHMYF
jgi:hypothetical protein